VDEDETLLRFVVALRRQSPKGLHLGASGAIHKPTAAAGGQQQHHHHKTQQERAPPS